MPGDRATTKGPVDDLGGRGFIDGGEDGGRSEGDDDSAGALPLGRPVRASLGDLTAILFVGGSWLFDEMHASGELRAPAAVLLATVVIVHAIWMAAGMALARLQATAERAEMHIWGTGLR